PALVSKLECEPQLLEHGDLSVSGSHTMNRLDLPGGGIVLETCSVDVIFRNDTFKRGLDHFFGRRGNHVEREMVTVETVQQSRQQANVFLQTDSLACFDQMLAPYAAIFRIMQQQIRQFLSF